MPSQTTQPTHDYDTLPTEEPPELGEPLMAHDWGHIIRQGAEALFGGGFGGGGASGTWTPPPQYQQMATPPAGTTGGGASGAIVTDITGMNGGCDGMAWTGGTPPRGYKVVNYCGQGVLRKIRRRRRKRMLTASDKSDIAAIVGLVGKGQMAAALINRSCG